MKKLLVGLWRRFFPLECEFCDFTSRFATVLGKHTKRCEVRRALAGEPSRV